MKAHWDRAIPNKDDLLLFDGNFNSSGNEITISKCIIDAESWKLLIVPNGIDSIVFNQVIFLESVQFQFEESVISISIQNSRLQSEGYFYQRNCSWTISHSVFEEFVRCNIGNRGIEIVCSKIQRIELNQEELTRVKVSDSWFDSFIIEKSFFNFNEESKDGPDFVHHFSFHGFVYDQILLDVGVKFYKIVIRCDRPDNESWDFGSIYLGGANIQKSIIIQAISSLISCNDEELLNKLYIENLNINFDQLRATRVVVAKLNVCRFEFCGRNFAVPVLVTECNIDEFHLDGYNHAKEAVVILRKLPRSKSRGSKYGNKFVVRDSIFNSNEFYFQACDFSDWCSSFIGSRFQYQSLSSLLPQKICDETDKGVFHDLESVNTWLDNSDKDSDIINYHDLKKQQWKLIWKKRESERNGLSNKEKFQFWAQLSNDFGTNWIRALKWLIIPNLLFLSLIHI